MTDYTLTTKTMTLASSKVSGLLVLLLLIAGCGDGLSTQTDEQAITATESASPFVTATSFSAVPEQNELDARADRLLEGLS